MKNFRLFSLIALALVISLALTSAYTPILSASNTKNNQNQVNSFGIPALACEVGYYGYNCKNSVASNKNSNNYYNGDYYYNNYNDNEYYYPGYYYNNYNRNYNSQYVYNINYQKNPPKTNYVLYTQDDKISYLRTYDTKQYRVYNSDYQVRYVRADPDRCSTKDYTYPCDFYYGKIQ